jgi:nitronate monooxygenase
MASKNVETASGLLGCRLPIVLAGMGGVARSELVAAVSRAGAFGFLGMVREPPELIREQVASVRAQGISRFGVNIIPAATERELLAGQADAIIALRVPVVAMFWDIDAELVRRFRDAGLVVAYQVGSRDEAIAAEQAGAQLIIAQGCEAGGHVRGTSPLCQLLPDVLKAVSAPVLAAGGLATGEDLVTVQALGADGIVLGTVLAAAEESFAHVHHKQRLVTGRAADTLVTTLFHINWPPNATVRVLSSPVTAGAYGPDRPDRPVVVGSEEGRPIYLYSTDSPLRSMSGDFEAMALYAGTGVDQITSIRPAGAIIEEIEAAARVEPIGDIGPAADPLELASPVCYLGEISGAYAGHLEAAELAIEMAELVHELRAPLPGLLESAVAAGPCQPFRGPGVTLARWIVAIAGTWLPRSAGRIVKADHASRSGVLERLVRITVGLPECDLRTRLSELRHWLSAQDWPQ